MSKENFITVDRSARVYTYGQLSSKTKNIWIAAHGYGMLAKFFIVKFEVLDPVENFIIVPEALSRGYLENMTGRVGASWMTNEMRQEEIRDYLNYLDRVVEEFTTPELLNDTNLIALGFSQGAATISRWVHHSSLNFRTMIMCGGIPAKELFSVNCFNNLSMIFAFGDKDVYLQPVSKERFREQIKGKGWSTEFIEYSGGHHLTSTLLSSISEKLY